MKKESRKEMFNKGFWRAITFSIIIAIIISNVESLLRKYNILVLISTLAMLFFLLIVIVKTFKEYKNL